MPVCVNTYYAYYAYYVIEASVLQKVKSDASTLMKDK